MAESSYLIEKYGGPRPEAAFLRSLTRRPFRVEQLTSADLERMARLVEQYADLALGATDASVVATAERLGIATLATLDRRHFTVVRPIHMSTFTLVP